LGYTMVYGILGLINFAHGDIVMVGALVALTVAQALAASGLPAPVVIVLATAAAIVVCVSLGLTIERVAYRPLRRAPRLAPLITAIGISILLQYSAALIWSKQYISMPELFKHELFVIGGAQFTDLQALIFILACSVMAGLLWFIKSSRVGKAMRATEQNPEVAGLMGVDTNRIIAFTFLLGSAVGAIAGVMVVLYYGLGHYFMGFMLGLKAFTAAVLGGIGNVVGAMLGGLLLGVIESLASGYIGDITGGVLGSNYRDIFAFLVLVMVLVLRPSGLLGQHTGDRA
jgi:branched-chain amino acid transport system permease protein